MLKKLLAVLMSVALMIPTSIPASALSILSEGIPNTIVYSPEFPDAYITVEAGTSNRSSSNKTVKATVYVLETYDEKNGETIVTSRLLSRDEVESIGIENFRAISGANDAPIGRSASNRKGSLTIELTLNDYSITTTSSSYDITGTASWSGSLYNGSNHPAVGSDYLGFAWGGNFACRNITAGGEYSTGYTLPITLCDSVANAALVWSFPELRVTGSLVHFARPIIGTTLYKNTREGNGNTTSVSLKYIHTYEKASGSISISSGSEGVSAGFSLSGVNDQWSLVCMITNLYY